MKWQNVKIDSLKANSRYSFVGGPFGSDLTTRDYVEDGVPVIRGTNLPDDREFFDDGFVYVREEKADALKSNTAYSGDLVFTQRGTLGQVGIIPEISRYYRYVISQSQMKLTVDPKRVCSRYVYYYFRHPETIQKVKNQALTSGVPHINLGILKTFEILLPPLPVQMKIVKVLSTFDGLIENNRQRMALLEDAARQVYQEWIVRLRFPGCENTRILDGMPEGWERKRLGDLAGINRENLNNSFDGIIEYIDIASVSPGQINGTTRYNLHDAPSRARRVVKHGDIIWSCVRPNRRSYAVIWNPPQNLIASTGFAVISPRAVPTSFLYQALTTDSFVGYLGNHAKGAAYPAVVAGDFERAEVLVPTDSLIAAFNDFAEHQMSQINNLLLQNQKLRTARDLLLPKLMSGEIPV